MTASQNNVHYLGLAGALLIICSAFDIGVHVFPYSLGRYRLGFKKHIPETQKKSRPGLGRLVNFHYKRTNYI
ncbi:MAG: hypothetical protein PHY09_17730 [Desulfuromonadaceae bacterium]|nr:hypothetical protein [Desulfuromonadaceae bacterium]